MNFIKVLKYLIVFFAILFIFSACHKKKKPFLLLPLVDNAASVDTGNNFGGSGSGSGDSGSGSGGSGSGSGGSGSGSGGSGSGSGDSGSGSGGSGSGSGGSGGFTAAVGELDLSFNGSGYKIKDDPGSNSSPDRAYNVLVLDDGSIMLIGSCRKTDISKNKICVAKFNSDGSVNTSFGTNGFQFYDISPGSDNAFTATIFNNKIYVGGTCDSKFCVLRLNLDGSLDNSFGLPFGSSRTGYIYQDVIGNGYEEGNSIYVNNDGIYRNKM